MQRVGLITNRLIIFEQVTQGVETRSVVQILNYINRLELDC